MNPSLRIAALLALVMLGIASCRWHHSGDKTSWRASSTHSVQKHRR